MQFPTSFTLATILLTSLVAGGVGCKRDSCPTQCQCRTLGNCARSGNECIPKKDEHCAASLSCKQFGACKVVDEKCQPTTDADCAQSAMCKVGQLCSVGGNRCVKK